MGDISAWVMPYQCAGGDAVRPNGDEASFNRVNPRIDVFDMVELRDYHGDIYHPTLPWRFGVREYLRCNPDDGKNRQGGSKCVTHQTRGIG